MKVICAGIFKTGTKSMHVALNELGYSVHDYLEHFEINCDNYMKIVKQGWTKEDFRVMYENVDSVCDGPSFYFWEDILEAFPDAKIVLTVKDSDDAWYKSISKQHFQLHEIKGFFIFNLLSWTFSRFWRFGYDAVMLALACNPRRDYSVTACPAPSMVWKQCYRRHIAYVKQTCPKEKLLVFNCKEGWEPLCKFLGKSVPDKPFPHINPNSELAGAIWETSIFKRATREVLVNSGMLALLVGFVAFKFVTERK